MPINKSIPMSHPVPGAGGLSHTSLPWSPCQPLSSSPGCAACAPLIPWALLAPPPPAKAAPLPLCCFFPTGALGRRWFPIPAASLPSLLLCPFVPFPEFPLS